MNRTLIVPEFDPDLQPIGYTLAFEFLEVGAFRDSSERMMAAATPVSARFGRESDTAVYAV